MGESYAFSPLYGPKDCPNIRGHTPLLLGLFLTPPSSPHPLFDIDIYIYIVTPSHVKALIVRLYLLFN